MKLKFIALLLMAFVAVALFVHADGSSFVFHDRMHNRVSLNLRTVAPHIESSTSLASNLKYKFIKERNKRGWTIQVCHKDYKKNFLENKKNQKAYSYFPIKTLRGEFKLGDYLHLNENCDKLYIEGNIGDKFEIGYHSTIITIGEDNLTYEVTPETKKCSYLKCTSKVVFYNANDYNISINSSNLIGSIHGEDMWIELKNFPYPFNVTKYSILDNSMKKFRWVENGTRIDYRNTTVNANEGFEILIPPKSNFTLYINSIIHHPNTQSKYNVILFYNGEEYNLDPYFITTNITFNGTYNHTHLNESGYIELDLPSWINGSYTSQIFDTNETSAFQNISWVSGGHYGEELPNNKTNEDDLGGLDMSKNRLLLHFNESSGDFIDTSIYEGLKDNGHPIGSVDYLAGGKFGKAVHLDGSSYIRIKEYRSLGYTSSSILYGAWFKPDSFPSYAGIISRQYYWGEGYGLIIRPNYTACTINSTYVGASVHLEKGKWYFGACRYVAGTKTMYTYLNGKIIASATNKVLNPSSHNMTIGSFYSSGSLKFNGSIDDVFLFSASKSDDFIKQMYERGAVRFNVSVRTCSSDDCSSGTSWVNVGSKSPVNLSVINNRYFQWHFDFLSENKDYTPKLYNVTFGYHPSSNCLIENNTPPSWSLYDPNQTHYFRIKIIGNTTPMSEEKFYIDGVEKNVTWEEPYYVAQTTSLSAGNHTYIWSLTQNDSCHVNWTSIYYVNQSSPHIHLFIDGYESNIEYQGEPKTINFSSYTSPSSNLVMYINGTLWNNGTSPISNISSLGIGDYIFNVSFFGNTNYTSASRQLSLKIVNFTSYCGNTTETLSVSSNSIYVQFCKSISFGKMFIKKNQSAEISMPLYLPDGTINNIPNTYCYFTLKYPNQSVSLSSAQMAFNGNGIYSIRINASNVAVSGDYAASISCQLPSGDTGLSSFGIFVNPSGIEPSLFRTATLAVGTLFMFIIAILLFLGFMFLRLKTPVKWTYFALSVIFFLIGINLISVNLRDVVVNPSLEKFFDSFTAISFIIYYFIGGILIIMWILTFLNTWFYKVNQNNLRKYGGGFME